MSDLLLIPVPGSTVNRKPVVRVVVLPRLDPAAGIAETGMAGWPSAIGAARFTVELSGGDEPLQDLAPELSFQLDVWRSFFGGLPVGAASAATRGGDLPAVVPSSTHADAILDTYRTAANAHLDAGTPGGPDTAVREKLAEHWADGTAQVPSSAAPPADLGVDFHRILSVLREHPTVLRALGLLFDLPLENRRLTATGTVRVRWPSPPAGLPAIVSPLTAFENHEDRGFLPASTSVIKAGLVDVGDITRWGSATFDISGAVGRLQDAALTASRSDDPITLPALRSAGISLLQRARADVLRTRREAVSARNREDADDQRPLTADDLMLGLRVDVRFKGAQQWTSLCRRHADYKVDGHQIGEPGEEEGHVKHAAAVRAGGGLRADEKVVRWDGWSLVVPNQRPGAREDGGNPPPLPFHFTRDFDVPQGSLLPLRFGRDYQLRVRVADLAGAGVSPDLLGGDGATPPISYGRVEPVGSPTLKLAPELDPKKLGPGGTLDQLVIRSDAPDYPRNDARLLGAPTTTLDILEQHGELDGDAAASFRDVQTALAGGVKDPAAEGLTVFCRPEPGGLSIQTQQLDWTAAGVKRLVLQEHPADATGPAIVTGADPDLIVVRLKPAESVTLELSSFLSPNHASHFALPDFDSGKPPPQLIKDGRHPMVSPSRVLTLVHAVRRPLGTPRGFLAAHREPGQISAVLRAEAGGSPLLGVDPASTAKVEVTARFVEVNDAESHDVLAEPVGALPLERGDQALPDLLHDFGDTRHREIHYTLTAVSRFRRLYNEEGEDDDFFITRAELPVVRVPSSAAPPAPVVRGVYPGFRWEDVQSGAVTKRRRMGGRLRVELNSPWNVSGADERLAVVAVHCEIARDPIWDTPGLTEVPTTPAGFEEAIQAVATVSPAAGGQPVAVVPYEAFHDGDSWWADIALGAAVAGSYRPFVRLALARYQRESLPGLELSPPVRTELVQVLPDRTLTVDTTAGGAVTVTLEGLGPAGPVANRVDVFLERAPSTEGIEVSVLDAPPGDASAWRVVGFASGPLDNAIRVEQPGGGGRLRARVREVEQIHPGAVSATPGSSAELGERVVFTDVVALP